MLVDEEACPRRLGTRARAWAATCRCCRTLARPCPEAFRRSTGFIASIGIFSAIECGYGRGGSGLQSSTLLSEAGTIISALCSHHRVHFTRR